MSDNIIEEFCSTYSICPNVYTRKEQVCDCGADVYHCVHCKKIQEVAVERVRYPSITDEKIIAIENVIWIAANRLGRVFYPRKGESKFIYEWMPINNAHHTCSINSDRADALADILTQIHFYLNDEECSRIKSITLEGFLYYD